MVHKRFQIPVSDRRRVERPLLELDPVLLLSTLAVGVILAALFIPAQIWGGVS